MSTAFAPSLTTPRLAYAQVVSKLARALRVTVNGAMFDVKLADPLTLLFDSILVGDWVMVAWQGEAPYAVARLDRRGTWNNSAVVALAARQVPAASTDAHDIIGPEHFVTGTRGQLVGVVTDNTLGLIDPSYLIEIIGGLGLGRKEGNHVYIMPGESDEGVLHLLQVTDSGGAALLEAGYVKDIPNSFFVKFGKTGGAQLTYLNDSTRDGVEKLGVWNVPMGDLAQYGGLPDEIVTELPDAFERPAAWRVALVNPSDPTTFVSYLRDNLDGWQLEQGPGYAQVHGHTSPETGGVLPSQTRTDQHLFSRELDVEATPGTLRLPNHTGQTLTIMRVFADINTAPVGSTLLVDIHKSGTTIFTDQDNRPVIAAGAYVSTEGWPDITAWADGEYLTCDVDQVGSTTPGANLTVTVVFTR